MQLEPTIKDRLPEKPETEKKILKEPPQGYPPNGVLKAIYRKISNVVGPNYGGPRKEVVVSEEDEANDLNIATDSSRS